MKQEKRTCALPEGALLSRRYLLQRQLGHGGMAIVYLAKDQKHGRTVVVKVPKAELLELPGFQERFESEIESLLELEHPRIVPVYDLGTYHGVPFAVLEFLRGGSLGDILDKRGVQRPHEVPTWLLPMAEALDFVDKRRVVHRDVKPGNILFDGSRRPYLSDFGISQATGRKQHVQASRSMAGTAGYMAPEQALDDDLDGRTDQYALASTLFRALTGHETHTGDTRIEVLFNKQRYPAPPLRDLVPRLPKPASEAVMCALNRDRSRRYGSSCEFAEAFVDGLRSRSSHPALTPSPRPRPQTVAGEFDRPRTEPAQASRGAAPADDAPSAFGWGWGLVVAVVIGATAVALMLF